MKTIGRIRTRSLTALQLLVLVLFTVLQGGCLLTSEEVRAIASGSLQNFVNGLVSNVAKDIFNAAFGLN
jgi:hypothetical protein